MLKKKWLLTDCFDTLLIRDCSPDYVKQKWAKHMEAIFSYRISSKQIYHARRSAERYLVAKTKNGEFNENELYHQIVNRLCSICEEEISCWDPDKLNELFKEAEFQVEKESLSINVAQAELLSHFPGSVAVVSDFYMSSAFLGRLFSHFGIADYMNKIYVSCEYRENKHSGTLYDVVLKDLGILPEEAEMYGDNMNADVKQAEKCGITAHLVKAGKPGNVIDYKNKIQSEIQKVLYPKMYKTESFSRFALTFYLFTERLYRRCVAKNIRNVYFLSREGELLKKLFDIYVKGMPQKIESHYLYISRKAVIRSTFKSIDYEDFSELRGNFSSVSLRKLMDFIGFSDAEIDMVEKESSVDLDEVLYEWWESERFTSILNCDAFRTSYEKITNGNRVLFRKYLEQNHFYDDEQIAIVDVGWNGTIQNRLERAANEGQTIFGYYCGLVSTADISKENKKEGILFSDIVGYSEDFDIWRYDNTFFERMLTASHASTDGYKDENGTIVPIFKEFSTETESYQMILPIHNLLIGSFENICDIVNASAFSAEDYYDYILKNHVRVMLSMGLGKAKFQQKLYENQADNLVSGSITKQKNANIFGVKQILLKGFRRLSVLRNVEIMVKILAQNHLFVFIPLISAIKRNEFLKKLKRRTIATENEGI